jgi:hypothetical protein
MHYISALTIYKKPLGDTISLRISKFSGGKKPEIFIEIRALNRNLKVKLLFHKPFLQVIDYILLKNTCFRKYLMLDETMCY